MENIILIPTLNPKVTLVKLIDDITALGADKIIIVNDGSCASKNYIFERLRKYDNVTVINHKRNRGKGAAIKTGLVYCMKRRKNCTGIITADDDGQHTPQDIFKISQALSENPECLVLGVRNFTKDNTPPKSYFGNRAMSRLFKILYNIELHDTQTGLRGIPFSTFKWMSKVKGNRFEYEINMLIQAIYKKLKFKEVSIELLYFDNNNSTHFNAIKDSAHILFLLLFSKLPFFKK